MEFRVSKSIKISTTPQQAFAYIADWRNATKVQANFSRFQPIDAAEIDAGVQVAVKGKFHGLPLSVKMRIVEFAPHSRIVSQATGTLRSLSAWLFEPTEDGRTKVTFVNQYDVPAPLVMLLGKNNFVEREINEMTEDSLRRLKKLLEGSDDGF